MAGNRDQQDVVLVPVTGTAHGLDFQEVVLVLGPAANPIGGSRDAQEAIFVLAPTPRVGTRPQLWVIT